MLVQGANRGGFAGAHGWPEHGYGSSGGGGGGGGAKSHKGQFRYNSEIRLLHLQKYKI